jgi:hypothetical protein
MTTTGLAGIEFALYNPHLLVSKEEVHAQSLKIYDELELPDVIKEVINKGKIEPQDLAIIMQRALGAMFDEEEDEDG